MSVSWRKLLTPWLEASALRSQNVALSHAVSNANTRIVELTAKLEILTDRPCETCGVLKQQVNHLLLASGSRVKMFDGFGPNIPEPKPVEPKAPSNIHISSRTSRVVRSMNDSFLQKFQQETGESIPFVPDEPAEEAIS